MLEGRALHVRDALRRAITSCRGSCSWTVDHVRRAAGLVLDAQWLPTALLTQEPPDPQ